eukprot:TRINITY_DN12071_c0_g1_i1.p1 TRINITY_DN12071_c0_g1~~TRINITY_DN12071_c0_g1_i1.p1  ORF type:complete len:826 (+),score=167.41 TRINITY_DN12071_c0_g1_i1:100-2577(+)
MAAAGMAPADGGGGGEGFHDAYVVMFILPAAGVCCIICLVFLRRWSRKRAELRITSRQVGQRLFVTSRERDFLSGQYRVQAMGDASAGASGQPVWLSQDNSEGLKAPRVILSVLPSAGAPSGAGRWCIARQSEVQGWPFQGGECTEEHLQLSRALWSSFPHSGRRPNECHSWHVGTVPGPAVADKSYKAEYTQVLTKPPGFDWPSEAQSACVPGADSAESADTPGLGRIAQSVAKEGEQAAPADGSRIFGLGPSMAPSSLDAWGRALAAFREAQSQVLPRSATLLGAAAAAGTQQSLDAAGAAPAAAPAAGSAGGELLQRGPASSSLGGAFLLPPGPAPGTARTSTTGTGVSLPTGTGSGATGTSNSWGGSKSSACRSLRTRESSSAESGSSAEDYDVAKPLSVPVGEGMPEDMRLLVQKLMMDNAQLRVALARTDGVTATRSPQQPELTPAPDSAAAPAAGRDSSSDSSDAWRPWVRNVLVSVEPQKDDAGRRGESPERAQRPNSRAGEASDYSASAPPTPVPPSTNPIGYRWRGVDPWREGAVSATLSETQAQNAPAPSLASSPLRSMDSSPRSDYWDAAQREHLRNMRAVAHGSAMAMQPMIPYGAPGSPHGSHRPGTLWVTMEPPDTARPSDRGIDSPLSPSRARPTSGFVSGPPPPAAGGRAPRSVSASTGGRLGCMSEVQSPDVHPTAPYAFRGRLSPPQPQHAQPALPPQQPHGPPQQQPWPPNARPPPPPEQARPKAPPQPSWLRQPGRQPQQQRQQQQQQSQWHQMQQPPPQQSHQQPQRQKQVTLGPVQGTIIQSSGAPRSRLWRPQQSSMWAPG